MKITNDIVYIGVNDTKIDLFESQYPVPDGVSYNSYAIVDEKLAITDTVDALFGEKWLENIKNSVGDRQPDYLIVHHMEPDHSANIARFAKEYPNAVIVATAKAFNMMAQFFCEDYSQRRIVAAEGTTLNLGKHTLTFYTAPMVHWPEVMVSYDSYDKVLFSADGFGKFGIPETNEPWEDEARRYYIGIVGKYGAQVQALLKKAKALDIQRICPLHGPVLESNIGYYIDLYDKWSSYQAQSEGVVIAYTSVYGNTKKAALLLADKLRSKGKTVVTYDLARTHVSYVVSDAFRYSHLVLATTTYNADIFPPMREFLYHLTERGFKGRTVGIIENGSWAPTAAKVVKQLFEASKDMTFADTVVTIKSALDDSSGQAISVLADEL